MSMVFVPIFADEQISFSRLSTTMPYEIARVLFTNLQQISFLNISQNVSFFAAF